MNAHFSQNCTDHVKSARAIMMLSSINGSYPLALSDRKELRHGTKSDLIDCLLNAYPQPDVLDPLVTHALIVDGAAAINMMKLRAAKTFLEYAFQVFYRYIENKFQNVSMVEEKGLF